jgi:UDP-glucose 4-epimerase
MRLLITGGCGFVGTNLVARLAGRNDVQVRVFDNESLGKREHLGAFAGEFFKGDLRDRAALEAALDGVDAVVHLAANTRVIESIEDPAENFDVNVIGSMNLLQAMRAKGVKRLVNASTGGAIVGEVPPPVHEELVPRPISPYGASKLAVEGYCSAFAGSYGFDAVSVRFANVYGPRSFHKGSVVAAFFKRILDGETLIVYGDGSQVRDYVYVGDICDGILAAMNSGKSGVYQIASGLPVTINELIAAMRVVAAPIEIKVEYRPARAGEIYATYCDISKARRDLGFSPGMSLERGLATTWEWFRSVGR